MLHPLPVERAGWHQPAPDLKRHTTLKDRQLAEVVLLVTGLPAVSKLHDSIHELRQQLWHRFAVDQLACVEIDPVLFFAASSLLVAIFTVGTNPPYGVPRPVLNNTM